MKRRMSIEGPPKLGKQKKQYPLYKAPVNKTRVNLGKGFPKTITESHKYNETVVLTSGASGVLASHVWSANGLYDPNITGVGHQPLYFDQLSALYNHYTVIGSKITVTVTPKSTTYPALQICGFIDDNATVAGNLFSCSEQSSAKTLTLANGANEPKYFVLKWSAKKNFGGSVLSNTDLKGTPSANPVDQSYFIVVLDSSTEVTPSAVQLTVNIEYTAVWSELRDIAGS